MISPRIHFDGRWLSAPGWLAAVLLATLAGPAAAVALVGTGAKADPGQRQVTALPTGGAVSATLDLVKASIDSVDVAAGTITLRGQAVPVHPERLRVLGPSGQNLGGLRALRAGMQVRLALEPVAASGSALSPAAAAAAAASAPPRRVVLVQVEGRP